MTERSQYSRTQVHIGSELKEFHPIQIGPDDLVVPSFKKSNGPEFEMPPARFAGEPPAFKQHWSGTKSVRVG